VFGKEEDGGGPEDPDPGRANEVADDDDVGSSKATAEEDVGSSRAEDSFAVGSSRCGEEEEPGRARPSRRGGDLLRWVELLLGVGFGPSVVVLRSWRIPRDSAERLSLLTLVPVLLLWVSLDDISVVRADFVLGFVTVLGGASGGKGDTTG
jgi:hypothetical protein